VSSDFLARLSESARVSDVGLESFEAFPIALNEMPKGWLTPLEMRMLYSIAKHSPGPILELGSWLGRSTVAIAAGIRDSGERKLFDTVDFGLSSPAEWEEMLKEPFDRFAKDDVVARSIFQPGGTIAVLIENLRASRLLPFVTSIIRGDSRNVPLRSQYAMVFCDTLHNKKEVEDYGPLLNALLPPGGWLVCDDVIDSNLGDVLRQHVDFDAWFYTNPIDKFTKFGVGRKRAAAI